MFDDVRPPINLTALADAARLVRRVLERTERAGDREAQETLLHMAVADELHAKLKSFVELAGRVAPTLDEIKINGSHFSADACQLRYEIDFATNILNQAAGRATVVALPVARATTGETPPPMGAA
jgi:hypothetical protein